MPIADALAPPDYAYPELRIWAEMFEDAQKARIAAENRAARASVDPSVYALHIAALKRVEHDVGLGMSRCYRRVVDPGIVAWQRATVGIGEHTLARILGVIGHPVHTVQHRWDGTGSDRVLVVVGYKRRRVSDLWSYCGHGDPARKRRRGMDADDVATAGNPRAKSLVHQLAGYCMRQHESPYRAVYLAGKERYANREDWKLLRQHNAALRLAAKAILRDLWIAAGGPHEVGDGHASRETNARVAIPA